MSKCQKKCCWVQLRFCFSFAAVAPLASRAVSRHTNVSPWNNLSALFGNDRTRMVFFLFPRLTNYYDAFLLFLNTIFFHCRYYIDFITFLTVWFLLLTPLIMNTNFYSFLLPKIPMNKYDMCASLHVSNKSQMNNGKNVDLIHAVRILSFISKMSKWLLKN